MIKLQLKISARIIFQIQKTQGQTLWGSRKLRITTKMSQLMQIKWPRIRQNKSSFCNYHKFWTSNYIKKQSLLLNKDAIPFNHRMSMKIYESSANKNSVKELSYKKKDFIRIRIRTITYITIPVNILVKSLINYNSTNNLLIVLL